MDKTKVTKKYVKPKTETKPQLATSKSGICRWVEESQRGSCSSRVEMQYDINGNTIFLEFKANCSLPIKENKKDVEKAIDEIKKHLTF